MTVCWLQDVESANMFIGSLIFVQELAEKVVEVRRVSHVFIHWTESAQVPQRLRLNNMKYVFSETIFGHRVSRR
jgi:hypothetical protein